MFRLSKWFKKSYRRAIEANIRRTRSSDLSMGLPARRFKAAEPPSVDEIVSPEACDMICK
jgi:hypothetical protein